MEKTVEELESELQTLKDGNTALAEKNQQLLDEMKKERRKNTENSGDLQKFYELQDKYDALKSEKTKLEHELKKSNDLLTTTTTEREEANGKLTNLLVDGGLTSELTKAGVKPEFLEATKALLRNKVTLEDGKAMTDGKELSEYMKEWATTDGKAFIAEPANGGGGAQGGQGGGGSIDEAKYFDKKSEHYNLTKQGEIAKTNPTLYKQLAG